VAIINHKNRSVLVGQRPNARQVRQCAIHRKHAVGGDYNMTDTRRFGVLQLGFKVSHIVVGIAKPLRFAQPDTRLQEYR
jgi:hypothetical protein